MTLTEPDIDEIGRIIDEKLPNINAKIDKILGLLSDFAGDVKSLQEEHTIQSGQVSDHEKRITALEVTTKQAVN